LPHYPPLFTTSSATNNSARSSYAETLQRLNPDKKKLLPTPQARDHFSSLQDSTIKGSYLARSTYLGDADDEIKLVTQSNSTKVDFEKLILKIRLEQLQLEFNNLKENYETTFLALNTSEAKIQECHIALTDAKYNFGLIGTITGSIILMLLASLFRAAQNINTLKNNPKGSNHKPIVVVVHPFSDDQTPEISLGRSATNSSTPMNSAALPNIAASAELVMDMEAGADPRSEHTEASENI
jgi:hypothetical protein